MKKSVISGALFVLAGILYGIYTINDRNSKIELLKARTKELNEQLVALTEKIDYYKRREAYLVNESGTAKQELNELKFAQRPVQIVYKPIKPTSNEKVVPVSKSSSEYYNDILSRRYKK
jgi:hypothetical protein